MSESDLEDTSCGPHPFRFVAVHLGVGRVRDEEKSLQFAKKLCEEIMLQTDKIQPPQTCSKCKVPRTEDITAETAVIELVKKMEDNPDLNCGLGSNLNMDGQVECDAGLMFTKTGAWAGAGALAGCKNPILFAKSLCDHQEIPRPLGLVQPNFLVGSGAKRWMREHCPELSVPDSNLISSRALSQYQKYKSNYDSAVKEETEGGPKKKQRQEDELDEVNLDTVGAIAVDHNYNFAAAVSSGGILLKHKGRIGQAAVPGGGCWARENVAVVTTGVGEVLNRLSAARSVAEYIEEFRTETFTLQEKSEFEYYMDEPDHEVEFNNRVARLFYRQNDLYKDPIGVLAVNTLWGGDHGELYFHYGHNSESMCIGYMTREDVTGHSIISKREHENDDKRPIVKTIVIPKIE